MNENYLIIENIGLFEEWCQQNINDDTLDLTFFSNKAWIHLDGYISSQNT